MLGAFARLFLLGCILLIVMMSIVHAGKGQRRGDMSPSIKEPTSLNERLYWLLAHAAPASDT